MFRIGWLLGIALMLCQLGPVAAPGVQNLTFGWDQSTNSGVAGYNLYYGSASGDYTNHVDAGNQTAATLSGLQEGATYYLAVTAYLTNGLESIPSSEIAVTVPGVVYLSGGATAATPAQLRFPALPGFAYDIEASQDLKTWTVIWSTTNAPTQWIDFTDTNSVSFPARYYRLILH